MCRRDGNRMEGGPRWDLAEVLGKQEARPVRYLTISAPQTVITTFPRAWPCCMYRMASGAWLSGYVLSMTGVT